MGFPNEQIYVILCIFFINKTNSSRDEATPVLQEVDQILYLDVESLSTRRLVMGHENHIVELWTIIPLSEVRPSISMYLIYKWSLGYIFTVIHLDPWLKRDADF